MWGERQGPARAMTTHDPRTQPPPKAVGPSLPSELAGLSRQDLLRAFEAAAALVVAITRSKDRVDAVVQTAFERLATVWPWDPSTGSLVGHVLGVVRDLLDAEIGADPDDHGDPQGRAARAARELDELRARVAGHPLAPRVLRCRAEGIERSPDIARSLDVTAEQVYAANKLLRYHLSEMRDRDSRSLEAAR